MKVFEQQMGDTKRVCIQGRFLHKSNRWFIISPYVGKIVDVAMEIIVMEYDCMQSFTFNAMLPNSQIYTYTFNFYGSGPTAYDFILKEIFQKMETPLDEILYA